MREKNPHLAKLPGQEHDSRARDRYRGLRAIDTREEILALMGDISELSAEESQAESYAAAAFVIEKFWEYLKTHFSEDSLTASEHSSAADTVGKRFVGSLNTALTQYQDAYFKEFLERLRSVPDEERDKEDALILRFFNLARVHTGRKVFPSMKDLVTLVGRMADVVPKVYERDVGRTPNQVELVAALKHPALKRFFMELMTNSRAVVKCIAAILEGRPDPDLNDPNREFTPVPFTLDSASGGVACVILQPQYASAFRIAWMRVAERQAADGKSAPRALQCPVLYTGAFVEMHDWVVDEFRKFVEAEQKITE